MRPFRALLIAAVLGGALSTGPARAQDGAQDFAKVRAALDTALANIQFARCGTELCAPASPEETASPPLTPQEAASVIERGITSAMAKACGLDWTGGSFQPMMTYWRGQKKSERQLALVGILHGMALGQTEALIGGKPCSAEMSAAARAGLSAFP